MQTQIFKACEALGGCIIFLDELDSLATSRDQGDMHEASRRLLGVLLREIDGFNHRDSGGSSSDGSGGDSSRRSVVIGATNRRQDLDAALLSRWVVGLCVTADAAGQPRRDGFAFLPSAGGAWLVCDFGGPLCMVCAGAPSNFVGT